MSANTRRKKALAPSLDALEAVSPVSTLSIGLGWLPELTDQLSSGWGKGDQTERMATEPEVSKLSSSYLRTPRSQGTLSQSGRTFEVRQQVRIARSGNISITPTVASGKQLTSETGSSLIAPIFGSSIGSAIDIENDTTGDMSASQVSFVAKPQSNGIRANNQSVSASSSQTTSSAGSENLPIQNPLDSSSTGTATLPVVTRSGGVGSTASALTDSGIRPMTKAPEFARLGSQSSSGMTTSSFDPDIRLMMSGGGSKQILPGYGYPDGTSVDGAVEDTVGAIPTFRVDSTYWSPIISVEWTVTDAYQNFQFNSNDGQNVTPYVNPTNTGNNETIFVWSENAGIHTVVADVAFLDGRNQEVKVVADIGEAANESFRRDYNILQWANAGGGPGGALTWQQHDFFTARVSTAGLNPTSPGVKFGFLQLYDQYSELWDSDGTVYGYRNKIDNKHMIYSRFGSTFLGSDWLSPLVAPGQTNVLISAAAAVTPYNSANEIGFDPALQIRDPLNYVNNVPFAEKAFIHIHFYSYLMYKEPGGMPVAAAKMEWELAATAVFNGGQPPLGRTTAYYLNPANWTTTVVLPGPNNGSYQLGSSSKEMPKWSGDRDTERYVIIPQP